MLKINNKIKLVIWDLDETYWSGTLSEGGIHYIQQNHEMIIKLAQRGIVSSICSKNDEAKTLAVLKDYEILDYIVSPRISWNPKGAVIKQLLKDLGLRAQNVLFIDDNLMNLHEAADFCDGLCVCTPEHISKLLENSWLEGKRDKTMIRLAQYKVIEKKLSAQINTGLTNMEFLRKSKITIAIDENTMNYFERVSEMVERTNQLNFTKVRLSKSELRDQILVAERSGVVIASDKYGDYGVCGFFLINGGSLNHYLFSCRVLNMYIESFVYSHLGRPLLNVQEPVSGYINVDFEVDFISIVKTSSLKMLKSKEIEQTHKNLIIGGCDLEQTTHYLDRNMYDTDFTYLNDDGVAIHLEHSEFQVQQINDFEFFSENIRSFPIDLKFNRSSSVFSKDYDNVIYSPLNDYSRGLYKCKKTGVVVPFDHYYFDWTDSSNWEVLPPHLKMLKQEAFIDLKTNWDFIGPITVNDFRKNIEILSKLCKSTLIVLTGSEVNTCVPKYADLSMEIRHKEFNSTLRELERLGLIRLIDIGKSIAEVNLKDSIRHYDKLTYRTIASAISALTAIPYLKPNIFLRLKRLKNALFWFLKSKLNSH